MTLGESDSARAMAMRCRWLVREEIGRALRQPHQLEQPRQALLDLGRGQGLIGDERLDDDRADAHPRIE